MSEAAVHAVEPKNRYLAPPWHTFVLIGSLLLPVLLRIHVALGTASSQVVPNLLPVYLRTIALEWALFGFVWYGVRKNGFSLRVLIGPRWQDTTAIIRDVAIGVGFAIVAFGCSKLIAALLRNSGGGASAVLPHTALQRAVWIVLAVTAGIVEETVYRGYLQTQFHRMGLSVPVALIAQAAIFGAVHLYQGWNHVVSIAAFGVIAGLIAEWRHSVRPTMIGHSLIDIAASVIRT